MSAQHKDMANAIRFLSMDAVQKANSGHPGMPMGMADAATVLFGRHMKYDAGHPEWPDRDRFVLSAGHGSMLLYSLLYLVGVEDVQLEDLKNFRQLDSKTPGHPEFGHTRGVETTTGPLGQGFSNAVGMALAERMMNARFGDDVVDHYTYTIAGDGCLMEGVSQEAMNLAGHLQLGKLICLWDNNGITIDGDLRLASSQDEPARFRAAGWDVQEVDGHDPEAISQAIEKAKASKQPSLINCRTTIGYGAPSMAGSEATHGAPLGDEEIQGAREGLGWHHGPFEVPEDVLSAWRAVGHRGAAAREAWEGRVKQLSADKQNEFWRLMEGRLPDGWRDAINDYKKKAATDHPKDATRKSSQGVIQAVMESVPELLGGSADLSGSNNTKGKGMEVVSADNYGGRYVHYGVREHAMASVMNGIALHGGFIPYGGTFLVFADYARPGMRMSSILHQRVIYVMTHDSIGLGEDGPTHQPVEHLASLRAMPGIRVLRPADAVETAEAWALALEHKDGPTVLALTRQGVPTVRTEHTEENLCARGAYVLKEADGDRKVTILATGSEVHLALEARETLQGEGHPTAVVSMPSWELFDQQPKDYRDKVLGHGSVRVAVEAAGTFGWERYVGPDGPVVGLDTFGASGPAGELYKHFNITADAVVKAARERL